VLSVTPWLKVVMPYKILYSVYKYINPRFGLYFAAGDGGLS